MMFVIEYKPRVDGLDPDVKSKYKVIDDPSVKQVRAILLPKQIDDLRLTDVTVLNWSVWEQVSDKKQLATEIKRLSGVNCYFELVTLKSIGDVCKVRRAPRVVYNITKGGFKIYKDGNLWTEFPCGYTPSRVKAELKAVLSKEDYRRFGPKKDLVVDLRDKRLTSDEVRELVDKPIKG